MHWPVQVAFIIVANNMLYLPHGTECQGLSFVLPFATPAPVVHASLTMCQSYQWRLQKGVPTRPRRTVGNTCHMLLSYPTCVPTLTNSSCRARCPDQLLYCSYWARCGVCHPVRYRPQVVCTVREYFASLAIELKSAAIAKP